MFMHNFLFLLYKEIKSNKSNFVYVVIHRCMLFIYVDVHLKPILAVTLFSIIQ